MIKAVLMDFGGTVDTDGIHWMRMFEQAYSMLAPHVTADALHDAYVRTERTLGTGGIIGPDFTFRDTLKAKIGLQKSFLEAGEGKNGGSDGNAGINATAILDFCYGKVCDNIGRVSRPAIERLHRDYRLCLVTNFYGNMHRVLTEFGLDPFFEPVIESSCVGVSKPDPEIFRLGISALGLEPAAVVAVGDSAGKDIIPAQTAGCRTIWLSGSAWDNTGCSPDAVIRSLAELPGAIGSLHQ